MEQFQDLIKRYLFTRKASDGHRRVQIKHLDNFLKYLSSSIGCSTTEVHLKHIYRVKDMSGQVIRYKPIDSLIIDKYLNHLIPCSFNHLYRAKYTLSAFFNWYNRTYEFPNPMLECTFDLKVFEPHKRPPRILTRHNVLRFFHCLLQHSEHLKRDLVLFCLLASTGCRISEILTLKVSQLNYDNETITLPKTKSGKPQAVILRRGMGKILQLYCGYFSLSESDFLFTVDGQQMRYNQVVTLFNKYLQLAQIPVVNIHSTRHSFATHLFENGADVSIIQQLLRHSDLQITMNYVHNNSVRNQGMKNRQNDELYTMLEG